MYYRSYHVNCWWDIDTARTRHPTPQINSLLDRVDPNEYISTLCYYPLPRFGRSQAIWTLIQPILCGLPIFVESINERCAFKSDIHVPCTPVAGNYSCCLFSVACGPISRLYSHWSPKYKVLRINGSTIDDIGNIMIDSLKPISLSIYLSIYRNRSIVVDSISTPTQIVLEKRPIYPVVVVVNVQPSLTLDSPHPIPLLEVDKIRALTFTQR